jgi:tetratricopeptide (TPR) repeat protein
MRPMSATSKPRKRWLLRLLALVVGLALAAGVGYWGWRRVEMLGKWETGLAALQAEDVEQAWPLLRECASYWPADPEVRFWAARAARRADAYEEAEEHLTACEKLHPPQPPDDVWFERLLLRAQEGETELLGRVASHLEAAQPARFALALEAMAKGYAATLQDVGAGQLAEVLLKRSPDNAQALLLRARLLTKYGHENMARATFETILGKVPHSVEARLAFGKVLLTLGEVPRATELYEGLLRDRPDHTEALYRLAQCRVDLSQFNEARRLLDRLLLAAPNHAEGLVERGRLEYRSGDLAAAEALLKRAVDAAPRNLEALESLACCLEKQGQLLNAEQYRKRREAEAIEAGRLSRTILHATSRPTDVEASLALGRDLTRAGRNDQALPYYLAVLQRERHQAEIHRFLADYFADGGQPFRAARHRRLAETTP